MLLSLEFKLVVSGHSRSCLTEGSGSTTSWVSTLMVTYKDRVSVERIMGVIRPLTACGCIGRFTVRKFCKIVGSCAIYATLVRHTALLPELYSPGMDCIHSFRELRLDMTVLVYLPVP